MALDSQVTRRQGASPSVKDANTCRICPTRHRSGTRNAKHWRALKGDAAHMPNRDLQIPTEQSVTQEFNRFLADVEQLLNSARQLTGDSAALARKRLEDKVAQAKVRLEAMRSTAAERGDWYAQRTKPWWANRSVRIVGLAALAGALITGVL